MEKILPEWFDENEFEKFLTEGPFTQQAWRKGMDRWRRTRVVLKNMLGKTPMRFMSRMMKNKHAILARTAIQNARDIQAAQNREEDMQAKRNYIRQEQVDVDFGELISENFQATSSPIINFGKESSGEVARGKNPTGNEKKFARLKKREQRRRKKLRGETIENMEISDQDGLDFLEEKDATNSLPKPNSKRKRHGTTPRSAKPTGRKKLTRRRRGARNAATENQGRSESGGQNEPGKKKSPGTETTPTGETDKNILTPVEEVKRGDFSDVLVVKSNGNVKIISKNSWSSLQNPELLAGGDKGEIKGKGELQRYLKNKNFVATQTSNEIFGREQSEKAEEDAKKRKEELKPEERRRKPESRSSGRKGPLRKGQLKINKFSVLPVLPEDENRQLNRISYKNAELLPLYPTLIELSQTGDDRLAEFIGENRIREINDYLRQNPGAIGRGRQVRDALFQLAQENPALQNQELTVIPFGDQRVCSETTPFFKQRGAKDKTPKTDIAVVRKSDLNRFLKAVNSKNCVEEMRKLAEDSYRVSIKKGVSILGSSQGEETLAIMDSVFETLRMFFDGKMDPEIKKQLDILVTEVKKLSELGNRGVFRTSKKNTWRSVGRGMEAGNVSLPGESNFEVQQFVMQAKNIQKNMNDMLSELFKNKIIKSAMIYEIAKGGGKFGADSMSSSQGIFCMDSSGQVSGTIPLAASFDQAVNDPRFGKLVEAIQLDVRTKSATYRGSEESKARALNLVLGTKIMDLNFLQPQQLQASHDPLSDNSLDVLFEYTFSPADITITTEVSPMTDQTSQMNPQMNSQPQQSIPIQQPGQEQNEEPELILNSDNIMSVLASLGYFSEITFRPADFAEIGMKASSVESSVYTRVTINNRPYDIPVINTGLDESFINEYDSINDDVVEMIKQGLMVEDAYKIFNEEIRVMLEEKRNYKREYKLYHGKPEQRARRSKRVLARRKMAKRLGKKAIKGKDIDHKNHNAMDNSDKNLRVRSINKNRSDNGHSKKQIAEKWGAGLEGSWELTLKWLKETPGQLEAIDPKLLELLMQNKGKSR